jgi:flagellar protein FliS
MRHYVYDSYQEAEILSASPLQLVRLLYRGAIEAIVTARRCLAVGDIAGRTKAINKALKIVTELLFSLDREKEPKLSGALVELYAYVQRRLIDANCRQVDPPLAEAQDLMATLQQAWENCEPAPRTSVSHRAKCEYEPVSCAG